MTREEAERLLALAREAKLVGPDAAKWVERLAPEREKLVEAARFLVENGEEEVAAELAANVWRVWHLSGQLDGGRRLVATALDTGQGRPSRARALALYGGGALAFRAGAQTESQARNEAALEAARAVGDLEAEALALVGLSRVAFREGEYARVRSLAARARELTRDLDPAAGAAPLHLLAAGTRLAGEYDEAVELYTESIGHIELHRGNVDAAERCFTECAHVRNQDDPYEAAMTHLNHAALAHARGERERAAELLRRTQSTLGAAGIVLDPDDDFEVEWLRDQLVRSSVDES